MKRVIVDYAKLTNEILTLLVERFPEGYDDSHIVRFKNAKNETIEAVEVRTEDTIYLVKVSTKLADRIENFDDDEDVTSGGDELDALKDLEMKDDEDEDSDSDSVDASDSDADGDDDDDDEDLDEDGLPRRKGNVDDDEDDDEDDEE